MTSKNIQTEKFEINKQITGYGYEVLIKSLDNTCNSNTNKISKIVLWNYTVIPSFETIQTLQELQLINCSTLIQLSPLPRNLQILVIQAAHFHIFPEELFYLQQLHTLKLIFCNIKYIPMYNQLFHNLIMLDLSHNKLHEHSFNENIWKELTKLTHINLLDNNFQEFPFGITFCIQLEQINLSDNKIRYLDPIIFTALIHLTLLNLSFNNLQILETSTQPFVLLPNQLLTLNISKNNLPNSFFDYYQLNQSLTYLDISFNQFTSIEKWYPILTDIKVLIINNNPLITLDYLSLIPLKLEYFNISYCQLKRLPSILYNSDLSHMKKLALSLGFMNSDINVSINHLKQKYPTLHIQVNPEQQNPIIQSDEIHAFDISDVEMNDLLLTQKKDKPILSTNTCMMIADINSKKYTFKKFNHQFRDMQSYYKIKRILNDHNQHIIPGYIHDANKHNFIINNYRIVNRSLIMNDETILTNSLQNKWMKHFSHSHYKLSIHLVTNLLYGNSTSMEKKKIVGVQSFEIEFPINITSNMCIVLKIVQHYNEINAYLTQYVKQEVKDNIDKIINLNETNIQQKVDEPSTTQPRRSNRIMKKNKEEDVDTKDEDNEDADNDESNTKNADINDVDSKVVDTKVADNQPIINQNLRRSERVKKRNGGMNNSITNSNRKDDQQSDIVEQLTPINETTNDIIGNTVLHLSNYKYKNRMYLKQGTYFLNASKTLYVKSDQSYLLNMNKHVPSIIIQTENEKIIFYLEITNKMESYTKTTLPIYIMKLQIESNQSKEISPIQITNDDNILIDINDTNRLFDDIKDNINIANTNTNTNDIDKMDIVLNTENTNKEKNKSIVNSYDVYDIDWLEIYLTEKNIPNDSEIIQFINDDLHSSPLEVIEPNQNSKAKIKGILDDIYNRAIYYGHSSNILSKDKLYEYIKLHYIGISYNVVKLYLKQRSVSVLYSKQTKKNFINKPIIATNLDERWAMDIVDITKYKKQNYGFSFILTIIDYFSKYGWAKVLNISDPKLLKDLNNNDAATATGKSKTNYCYAILSIMLEYNICPSIIQCDNEFVFSDSSIPNDPTGYLKYLFNILIEKNYIELSEDRKNWFYNKLNMLQIVYSTPYKPTTNGIIESFNRELRNKIDIYIATHDTSKKKLYIHNLQGLISDWNSQVHSTTNYTPIYIRQILTKLNWKEYNLISIPTDQEIEYAKQLRDIIIINFQSRARHLISKNKAKPLLIGTWVYIATSSLSTQLREQQKGAISKEYLLKWYPFIFHICSIRSKLRSKLGYQKEEYIVDYPQWNVSTNQYEFVRLFGSSKSNLTDATLNNNNKTFFSSEILPVNDIMQVAFQTNYVDAYKKYCNIDIKEENYLSTIIIDKIQQIM